MERTHTGFLHHPQIRQQCVKNGLRGFVKWTMSIGKSYVEQPVYEIEFATPYKRMSSVLCAVLPVERCRAREESVRNKLGAYQGQGHGLLAGLLQHVCMGTLCARCRVCLLRLTQYHLGNINDAFADGIPTDVSEEGRETVCTGGSRQPFHVVAIGVICLLQMLSGLLTMDVMQPRIFFTRLSVLCT